MEGYNHRPDRDDTDIIGARIGARIIDSTVGIILVVLVYIPFGMLGSMVGRSGGIELLGLLVVLAVTVGYNFLLEGLWDGQTVGKRLFGIKVVEEDGSPCSLGSSFIRNLVRFIDGFFYYAVGFISMASSDKRQRIGDRIAETVVVREQN